MNLKKELFMESKKSLVMNFKNSLIKYLIFSLCLLNSCSDNDDNYVGANNAYLTTDKGTTLTVGENQPLNAKLTLASKVAQDTDVKLKITNETNADLQVIKVTPQNIEIKANTREASFKITVLDKVSIIEPQTIKISIEEQPLITAKEDLTITVNPAPNIQELTAEQKKLLEGYKKKGMDITPFLGKQKVKTTIISNSDEESEGYLPSSKQYEGITVIELSEQSTPDQPVLKMTKNPMGMTEAFQYLLEHETIFNDDWYGKDAGQLYAKVMKLINWNKTSKETLSSSLDSIKIKTPKNEISDIDYIGKGEDSYGDTIDVVPFKFSYTAWDRLKKLIDKGNKEAIECNEGGATSNPSSYINNTSITEDEYYTGGEGLYKKTTGVINFKEGTMTFGFITSHELGEDYLRVTAEYSIK